MSNVLISGQLPLSYDPANKFFDYARSCNSNVVVLDDYNTLCYPFAKEITIAELLPYLEKEECARIFENIVRENNPNLCALVYDFVSKFMEYSNDLRVSFFDAWDLESILKISSMDAPKMHRFLINNQSRLNDLNNEIISAKNLIGKPKYDVSRIVNGSSIFVVKQPEIVNTAYDKKLLQILLNGINQFFEKSRTKLYVNGLNHDNEDILLEFISKSKVDKMIVVDDVYSYKEKVSSALCLNINKMIFFKHNSNYSCEQISKRLCEKDTIKITATSYPTGVAGRIRRNITGVFHPSNSFSTVSMNSGNTGFSFVKTKEARMTPTDILNLPNNQYISLDVNKNMYEIKTVEEDVSNE